MRFEHEARALLGAGRAALEVAADAGAVVTPADQLALHRRLRAPIDFRKAARERASVIAAIGFGLDRERFDGGEPVRHLGLRQQVAPAELDPIEAELGRGDVEQPLTKEVGFVAPRPAVGSRWRLVGHHQRDVDADMGDAIGAGEHLREIARGGRAVGADVGALIGPGVAAQRPDRAIRVAGDLQLAFGIAGMIGGAEVFAAILDPFHRPAGEARRERDQKIFRIEFAARAEASADVVFHHPDRAFGQLHLLCQNAPVEEGDLGRAEDREQTARRVPFRQQSTRLHRHGAVALDREFFAAHVRRVLESTIRVAAHASECERAIAGRGFEQQGVVSCGVGAGDDRRQGLDREGDGVEGVFGGGGTLGQHDRDGFADIADLVVGDDRLLERREGRRGVLPQRDGRHRGADVCRRDDGVHAGPGPGDSGIDRADAAVRHRTAQDHGVQEILAREVVDEFAAPAQQAKILDAFDRAPDEGVGRALLVHVR